MGLNSLISKTSGDDKTVKKRSLSNFKKLQNLTRSVLVPPFFKSDSCFEINTAFNQNPLKMQFKSTDNSKNMPKVRQDNGQTPY